MAHPHIPRIDAIAARRIGRAAQIAALPPQPARSGADLWQFTRRSWVHERQPRALSLSIGELPPPQALLQQSPALQARIAEQFPGIDLDELILSPELPIDVFNAIRFQQVSFDPSLPTPDQLAQFQPSGITQTASVSSNGASVPANSTVELEGDTIAAPCILRGASWYVVDDSANAEVTISVDAWRAISQISTRGSGVSANQQLGGNQAGINAWILTGTLIPRLRFTDLSGGTNAAPSSGLVITAEPLIRVA